MSEDVLTSIRLHLLMKCGREFSLSVELGLARVCFLGVYVGPNYHPDSLLRLLEECRDRREVSYRLTTGKVAEILATGKPVL